jgi:hypothetical protein
MIIGKKEKERSGLIEKDLYCLRQCGSANNELSENEGGRCRRGMFFETLIHQIFYSAIRTTVTD